MPNLLLIQPSQYSVKTNQLLKYRRLHLPSLALPLLAALVPKHWFVDLVYEVIEDVDFNASCDIVGISTMGHSVYRAIEIADEFRKKGKVVFMGGCISSLIPEIITKHSDGYVIGDAEITLPKLLSDFELTGKISKKYDNQVKDLNNIPIPRYDLLVKKRIGTMLPVQASRGCPHSCSFCYTACIYNGRYLTRPIDDIIRDIKEIKRLGYNSFYLVDDNIYGDKLFLEEFVTKIKPLKMKWSSQCSIELAEDERLTKLVADSGCKILGFGIESIIQEGVNSLNKSWIKVSQIEKNLRRIRKSGILLQIGIMIGTDSDTEVSLKETYRFIVKNKIAIPYIAILTPTPNSKLYHKLKNEGRLLHSDYSKYNASYCVHKPSKITPEKVEDYYWLMNDKIFSLSCIIKRTLLTTDIFKSPLYCIFAFYSNLHYRNNYKTRSASIIF